MNKTPSQYRRDWDYLEVVNGRSPVTGRPWLPRVKTKAETHHAVSRAAQSAETAENAEAIDAELAELERAGLLSLNETKGRKYSY